MYAFSAIQIRDHFIDGNYSAQSIINYFLKRIQSYDVSIGAFLEVFSETALIQAEQLDRKRAMNQPLGKLAGIPVSVKDNILVKNERMSCGSIFLHNFIAPFDATAIALLKAEDAIIIGRTNMDECAMGSSTENSAYQKTYNPWNLTCSPGGSSGGCAAAVAARLSPISLGSDTGGSVRQPAAFCGVVGYKPSYGRISRSGLVALGSSLDQIGPMTTNVKDAALIMEVIGRHCKKDQTTFNNGPEDYLRNMPNYLHGITIGLPNSLLAWLEPEEKHIFLNSVETLKNMGILFVDLDLSLLKYSIATYYVIAASEATTNLACFDGIRYGRRSQRAETVDQVYTFSREEALGMEVKRRIILGTLMLSQDFHERYFLKAQKVRRLISQEYEKAFRQCDLIALPTTPSAAFEIASTKEPLKMYMQDIFTIGVNLAGLPAINLPNGFTADRKPTGLQLIAKSGHDVDLIQAAHVIEQAMPFNREIPDWVKDV